MSEVPRPTLGAWFTSAGLVAATVLGAASYLMALAEFQRLWIVVAAAPFALLISALLVTLFWGATGVWYGRIILGIMAVGFAGTGISESGRMGTLLMGCAFALIALLPAPQNPADKIK